MIYDVKVFLKSGQIMEFQAANIEKKKNGFGGTIGMSWENVNGEEMCVYMDWDEVSGITCKART